jgi:hypothetical protein
VSRLDSSGSGYVAGSSQHGNEPSGSIKDGNFRGRRIDYQLVKDTIEQAEVAVTRYTYIREALGSNLGRDTGYSEVIRGFPHSLTHLFKSFLIQLSRYHPTLHSYSPSWKRR